MAEAAEQHWRDSVVRVYNRIGLSGLAERDPHLHEVPLERVFVTLNVEVNQPVAGFIRERAKRAGRDPEDHPALLEQALIEPDRLGDRFQEPRLPILPELRRFAERFRSRLCRRGAGTDRRDQAMQAPPLEGVQKGAPVGLGLAQRHRHPQHLAPALLIHPQGHQDCRIDHHAPVAPLLVARLQVDIRTTPQGPLAPLLQTAIQFRRRPADQTHDRRLARSVVAPPMALYPQPGANLQKQ